MNTSTSIWGLFKTRIPPELSLILMRICPEADQGKSFRFEFKSGDKRLDEVQSVLTRYGLKVWDGDGERKDNEYPLRRHRHYERKDFDSLVLCEPELPESLEGVTKRTSQGFLAVSPSLARPADIGRVDPNMLAVSKRLKILMENAHLHGLVFLPAVVIGDNADDFLQDAYWELTSDVRLPRLSPECRLIDGLGGMYVDGKSHACIVDDGFSPSEMRYRASDLAQIGPFDLARTHEPIGSKDGTFVASKRFYEFCQEQKLAMDWVPVRVD